jgi:hypothetical protein
MIHGAISASFRNVLERGPRHIVTAALLYGVRFSFLRGSDGTHRIIRTRQRLPEVKETYEKVLRGKPGNAQKALAHRPEMLKNFLSFYASVGRSLDRKL